MSHCVCVHSLTPADGFVFASLGHSLDEMHTVWEVGARFGDEIQDAVLVKVPAKADLYVVSSLLGLVFAHPFLKAQNS